MVVENSVGMATPNATKQVFASASVRGQLSLKPT
jgi:hypothetical protein